ncbi:UNVERIFIED_CONTAM: AAA domain-containing protein [Williamsia faeni]
MVFAASVANERWPKPAHAQKSRVCLALAGLPGAGQSAIANKVVETTGFSALHLSSDVVRRKLFPEARSDNPLEGDLTYAELTSKTIEALNSGSDVVLDGTVFGGNPDDSIVEGVLAEARENGHETVGVLLDANHEPLRRRVNSSHLPPRGFFSA